MTESGTHKFIKEKIAEALSELGCDTKTEHRVKEGRLDVYAKKGINEIKVEVIKTHIPEWILAKVSGDIPEKETKRKPYKIRNNSNMGLFYKGFALGIIQRDGTIVCMACVYSGQKNCTQSYPEVKFHTHFIEEHIPPDPELFSQLQFRDENNEHTKLY